MALRSPKHPLASNQSREYPAAGSRQVAKLPCPIPNLRVIPSSQALIPEIRQPVHFEPETGIDFFATGMIVSLRRRSRTARNAVETGKTARRHANACNVPGIAHYGRRKGAFAP